MVNESELFEVQSWKSLPILISSASGTGVTGNICFMNLLGTDLFYELTRY